MGAFVIIIIVVLIVIWVNSGNSSSNSNTNRNINTTQKPDSTRNIQHDIDAIFKQINERHEKTEAVLNEFKIIQEQERKKIADIARIKEEQIKKERCKPNWQEYQETISVNKIQTLYHFTDRANLQSIKRHGALYSWHYCDNNNIPIPAPGGDDLSRSLDRRYNLQNYVRVSFTRNHPMMYIALNQNRITNPVILEIDPEVIFWNNTKYANKNATRNDVSIGSEVEDFRKIRFDIVRLNKHFDLEDSDRPYFQAEVLILEKIPIEFILNIDRV